jgi:hypothetical protein
MRTDPASKPTTELVLTELGRCLLTYQSIEGLLKILLPHVRASETELSGVPVFDWRELLDSKKTLGALAKLFLDRTTILGGESVASSLTILVEHRNEVVHHFLEQNFAALSDLSQRQQALDYLSVRGQFAARWLEVVKRLTTEMLLDPNQPSPVH